MHLKLGSENLRSKPNSIANPTYGASDRYLGQKGEEYFTRQARLGALNGQIEAHKFRHLIRPIDTVVDFGCGSGHLLRALDCSRRIGVEINPIARQYCIELGIECYEDLGDVSDEVADVAISNHALEHIPYPIEALRLLRCKLKQNGILAICVPIDDWRVHKLYDPNDPNHHLHSWTIQLLGNSLSEAGFAVHNGDIRVMTHSWPWYYHFVYVNLPLPLFNMFCTIWAIIARRRQLFAVVKPR